MGSAAHQRVIANRFQVTRLLGEGAFAHVYRAHDLSSGREVAVKVLKETMRNDPEVVERFRREVFAVASIDSPHVVRLYDFGISGDEVFIAMEYVEGPTLRDLLGGKPLSPDAAHIVVGQIAQAVAAAHDQNIIHRDLKPENVVLVRGTRGRQAKVLDFGLAKIVELEQQLELKPLTKDGMCFGTPQYMSPEQIQGHKSERAGDLWAVAVIAYEIVAGRLPWDGGGVREVFYSILSRPLPPITTAHRSLVRIDEINRFFARALSRKPEERPADAPALFGAFEQALFGGPHAPAATVFSGIISAEFALPAADEAEAEAGRDATFDDTSLRVTPESTAPGTRSRRKLPAQWLDVGPLPSLSPTMPGEAGRLQPPPPAANAEATARTLHADGFKTTERNPTPVVDEPAAAGTTPATETTPARAAPATGTTPVRAAPATGTTPARAAPATTQATPPAVAPSAAPPAAAPAHATPRVGRAFLLLVVILLAAAALIGYWVGTHR